MANLENIQFAAGKTGLNLIGRIVRGADLYYYDFIAGGNTFVATDSANTRIAMPARSAPQNYIYESAAFDIETWDDGWYEWQVYDVTDKLLALSRYYIFNGNLMFEKYLVGLKTDISGVKAKTDNLPTDPASETNATINKDALITEIDNNEVKIDSVQGDVSAIKAKTDNLPIDPAAESNATINKNAIVAEVNENEGKIDAVDGKVNIVDSNVDAIKSKTDNLPVDPTSESNATSNKDGIITEVDNNEIKIDSIQADTIAIKAKTSGLPIDPASEINADANKAEIISEINGNESKLDNIKLDTAAIKPKTDNLPSDPASQSQVETAISASESNIRGDGITLQILADAIGSIIPDILAIEIDDDPPVRTWEYYIRYSGRMAG